MLKLLLEVVRPDAPPSQRVQEDEIELPGVPAENQLITIGPETFFVSKVEWHVGEHDGYVAKLTVGLLLTMPHG